MTSAEKDDASQQSPARKRLRGAWERVLQGEGRSAQVLTGALVVLLALASAFVLVPLRPHPVVGYDDRHLGTYSDGVIKADRDYAIPDEETTQRKREEARQTVRAVYDYDAAAADGIVRRVHEAFNQMRQAYGDWRLDLARQAADRDAETPEEDPKAVAQVFAEEKAEFLQLLQVVVDEKEFDVLARARFDARLESAVAQLVAEAMRRPVVADVQLLAADRDHGIIVRPVPARDSRDERAVENVEDEVVDLVTARATTSERLPKLLPDAAPETRAVVGRLARRLIRPNLSFNREETLARQDRAAESVKASVIQVARGEKIIGDGERIERRHLLIFRGMREQVEALDTASIHVGAGLLSLLVVLGLFAFARGGVWRFRPTRKDLIFLLVALVGTLVATRAGLFVADVVSDRLANVPGQALWFALPVGAAIVLVRLVLNAEITLAFAVVLSVFTGVLTDGSLGFSAYVFVGGMVAADRVGRARDRGGIWRAGAIMALVNVAMVVALGLHSGNATAHEVVVGATGGIFAAAVTPLIVLGMTFLVEKIFGYTTDLTLLELANLNNPLLKELVVAAPGTYHHSMMLGSMVEAAAEAIGANPLLARVGSYYHDIGKGRQPLYFAENQRGENPHDKLAPSMSALVIRRHVTDGIKMAKAAGLPEPIIDMIPMHHGTRQMAYFWNKAKEESEREGKPVPSDTEYRHIGPKPRFREAALLMIADSVEAASRTLQEPNADRFRGVVQKVINTCFADGQFDECDITLKDLHAVTRSFVHSLEGIYHHRPEYQAPADKSDKAKAASAKAAESAKAPEPAQSGRNGESVEPAPGNEKVPAAGAGTAAEPRAASDKNGGDKKNGGEKRAGVDKAAPEAPPAPRPAPAAAQSTPESDEADQPEGEALKRLGTN